MHFLYAVRQYRRCKSYISEIVKMWLHTGRVNVSCDLDAWNTVLDVLTKYSAHKLQSQV